MTTDTPSTPAADDLVNWLSFHTDLRCNLAATEITSLRAELAEAKLELDAAMVSAKSWMDHSAVVTKEKTQAEAARDRFAAVIATEGVGKWRNEAIAHHRTKQEKEQNRG